MINTNGFIGKKMRVRADKDGGMPQNTRGDKSYEVLAVRSGTRKIEKKNTHEKVDIEDILNVYYVNDAGYVENVYLSRCDFKEVKEKS